MPISQEDLDFLAAVRKCDCAAVVKRLSKQKKLPAGSLFMAVSTGQMSIVDLLLSKRHFPKNELDYVLHSAVETGWWALAECLLSKGGDPHAKKGLNYTPLVMTVASKGNVEFTQRLLGLGADPNAHDIPWGANLLGTSIGHTVLMAAAENSHTEVVSLLLEAGANPWLKGVENKTAYDLVAKRKGREAVASLLFNWMQRNPQTPSPPVAPKVLDCDTPFGSWSDAIRRLELATSGKAALHPQARLVRRFQFSLNAATMIAGKVASGEPLEIYRHALSAVQKLDTGLNATWFLQFEPVQGAFLCGLPKANKWRVLGVFETACANFGVTHNAVLKFLKVLDGLQPFVLVECDFSSVGGRFSGKVDRPDNVAKQLFEFCPFVAQDDGGSVTRFAKRLAKTGYFKIWWD